MVKQRGKSGVWYARITARDATGKKKQKWVSLPGAKNEREAKREEARLLTEMRAGTFIDPTKQKFGPFLEEWLVGMKIQLGARTHAEYVGKARRQIIPHLGEIPLQKLTANHIRSTLAQLLENGRVDGKGGLDASTVERCYSIMRQALQQAVDDERLLKNPAAKVKPPRRERKEMVAPDEGQTALLLMEAAQARPRTTPLYLPILVLATTALRRNEALGLRWQDVDLERGLLTVNQTLVQMKGGVTVKPSAKSTTSHRTIQLPPITVDALRRHREEQFARRQELGEAYQDQGLIFERGDGSPIRPSHFSNALADLARKAGLKGVHVHSLRHGHISQLIAQGAPLKAIQGRAGHSRIQTTLDTYAHLFPGAEDAMVETFDAALRAALAKEKGQVANG